MENEKQGEKNAMEIGALVVLESGEQYAIEDGNEYYLYLGEEEKEAKKLREKFLRTLHTKRPEGVE